MLLHASHVLELGSAALRWGDTPESILEHDFVSLVLLPLLEGLAHPAHGLSSGTASGASDELLLGLSRMQAALLPIAVQASGGKLSPSALGTSGDAEPPFASVKLIGKRDDGSDASSSLHLSGGGRIAKLPSGVYALTDKAMGRSGKCARGRSDVVARRARLSLAGMWLQNAVTECGDGMWLRLSPAGASRVCCAGTSAPPS
jgi:hypothetical protein